MSATKLKLVPATAEVPHPILRDRKSIVAGTLLARSFDRSLTVLDPAESDMLHDMRTGAANAAANRSSCGDGGRSLTHHLSTVRDALTRAAGSGTKDALAIEELRGHAGREIVGHFDRELARIDCERCGRAHGHTCDGSERDHATMRGRPECWSAFNDVFSFALMAAETAYDQFVPDLPVFQGLPATQVSFTTTVINGDELVASTKFQPTDCFALRQAEVVVDVPRAMADPNAYYGLIYQVFHEVIVHVVQAARRASRRRGLGSDCAFAEGLVDSAAFLILTRALDTEWGTPTSADFADLAERFMQRARWQREDRCRLGPLGLDNARQLAGRARSAGRSCFDKIVAVRGGPDGERWAIQLALCLNLEDLDAARRRTLLIAISEGITSPVISDRRRACRALDAYLEHGDITRLFAGLAGS